MERPIALRQLASCFALAVTVSGGLGCASSEAVRREKLRAAHQQERDARPSHIQPAKDVDDPATEMTIAGTEGTLNTADIDNALAAHMAEIRDCYRLGGRSPTRAAGRVLLRFFVSGKGEVDQVSVLESNIGQPRVERCLADIGVGIVFDPPGGHKPTTFDYPFEFRPGRNVAVDRQRR